MHEEEEYEPRDPYARISIRITQCQIEYCSFEISILSAVMHSHAQLSQPTHDRFVANLSFSPNKKRKNIYKNLDYCAIHFIMQVE